MSRFRLPLWLATSERLSQIIEGDVTRSTEKGLFIVGHAAVMAGTKCLRCGRELVNPISLRVGYGPICCESLGIDRSIFDSCSPEELSRRIIEQTKFERWFPRKYVQCIEGTSENIVPTDPSENCSTVNVTQVGQYLFVSSSYEDGKTIKTFPTRSWDPDRRAWKLPNSELTRIRLQEAFGDRLVGVEVSTPTTISYGQQLPPELFSYQKEGVQFLLSHPRTLLGDEMGLGKTVQTITALRLQLRPGEHALVVCPNTLKQTWSKEFRRWAPDISTVIIQGDSTSRLNQIGTAQVTIINFELLRKARGKPDWSSDVQALLGRPWQYLVVDEAHRIKNRDAQVTRALRLIAKSIRVVYLLTGTPILNRLEEAWTLFSVLYPTEYHSYWQFVSRYCIVTNNGFGADIGPIRSDMLPELKDTLSHFMLRRLKREVLPSLPGKLPTQQIWIPLEGETRRIYREMARELYTTLESGEQVSAAVVIAQITRLKQIVIDPSLMIHDIAPLKGAKIDALLELLSSIEPQPIVVFSQFAEALRRLRSTLEQAGYTTGLITGDITGDARQDEIDRFQTASGSYILLCGLKSGGVGITLTNAHIAVFLDKFWSPALNWQAQERLDRIGQTEPVQIIELLAEHSVEEGIEDLLSSKIADFSALFDRSEEVLQQTQLSSSTFADFRRILSTGL